MVPSETAGRKGRQPDGTSLTREVKVGRLFTQTGFDEDGGPILDRGSTSYIAHFDTSEQFAAKLAAEALARDFHHAPRLAVLADGARWIWNLADKLWPDAIQIVDYYHASKHVNDLADLLKPACPDPAAVRQTLKGHLAAGDVQALADTVRGLTADAGPALAGEAGKALAYFTRNHHRMRYDAFKDQGLWIGSGAIESACKVISEQRAALSGMRWTVDGLDPIIALRALHRTDHDNRYDDAFDRTFPRTAPITAAHQQT